MACWNAPCAGEDAIKAARKVLQLARAAREQQIRQKQEHVQVVPPFPAPSALPCARERVREGGERDREFIRNYSKLRILKALALRALRPSGTSPSRCARSALSASLLPVALSAIMPPTHSSPPPPPPHAAFVSCVVLAGPLPVILPAIAPRAPSVSRSAFTYSRTLETARLHSLNGPR